MLGLGEYRYDLVSTIRGTASPIASTEESNEQLVFITDVYSAPCMEGVTLLKNERDNLEQLLIRNRVFWGGCRRRPVARLTWVGGY